MREIRSLWKTGELTKAELATRFNTSTTNISQIVARKTWADVYQRRTVQVRAA
ncbi:MAG: hypothetical protein ACRDRJ_05130 [Streptosporangiaceae bacterium]